MHCDALSDMNLSEWGQLCIPSIAQAELEWRLYSPPCMTARQPLRVQRAAIASISTFAPNGNVLTAKHARAGGSVLKKRPAQVVAIKDLRLPAEQEEIAASKELYIHAKPWGSSDGMHVPKYLPHLKAELITPNREADGHGLFLWRERDTA